MPSLSLLGEIWGLTQPFKISVFVLGSVTDYQSDGRGGRPMAINCNSSFRSVH